MATNIFHTTGGVNLRSSASTDADIIRVVDEGTSVQILHHDPAGWSRVNVNGAEGFIRSDFLTFPQANAPVTFRAVSGVNVRSAPSTESAILTVVNIGNQVSVLEHDPAGWSRVNANGAIEGFIRSDLLELSSFGTIGSSSEPVAAQPPTTLMTIGGVNFRSSPSSENDNNIINQINAGTTVEIINYNPGGWSYVRVNGSTGYIRTDLLSRNVVNRQVELLTWAEARRLITLHRDIPVVDVRTGLSFTIRAFSLGGHADVEPVTQADTDTIFQTRNGRWSWAARPVWVTLGGRTIAASINGMPHDVSTISGNGMDGHLCLHFWGTVTNNARYGRDLNNAVMEAYNAAR